MYVCVYAYVCMCLYVHTIEYIYSNSANCTDFI